MRRLLSEKLNYYDCYKIGIMFIVSCIPILSLSLSSHTASHEPTSDQPTDIGTT